MSEVCSECQSPRLEPAILASAAVQPDRAGRLAKALAAAEVRVRVCLGCGRIDQMRADVERLRKMVGED